eukprot:m.107745 g.107745  ORF g.107745 m.107745 type:complete len:460 (+) comp13942_c0_seq2:293-1672(+)
MSNKLAEDSLGSKGKVCELAKDRLYFLTTTTPPLNHGNYHFFCVDNIYEYRGFYADFGPLHIANTAEYCRLLKGLLESPRFNDKIIVHYTSTEPDKRTNAACLMAAFSILYFKKSVEDAYRPFSRLSPPLASFRDAAYGSCSFKLSVLDVLRGLSQALLHNWIDYEKFDCEHYRHHERVENGDLNWHIPGKFLAFAGPQDQRQYPCYLTEDYCKYFQEHNVTDIIRLNEKQYSEQIFLDAGFRFHELYFLDGSTPSSVILNKFLKISEAAEGAVAVHCKAGLGRTGTLIACYMMKHYLMTARECIGWMRLCRPGSIIGPQQYYLVEKETAMWSAGQEICKRKPGPGGEKFAEWAESAHTLGIENMTINQCSGDTNISGVEQGDGLLIQKRARLKHRSATTGALPVSSLLHEELPGARRTSLEPSLPNNSIVQNVVPAPNKSSIVDRKSQENARGFDQIE